MSDPVVTPVQKALDKVATKKWFQFGTKVKAKAQKDALEPVSVVEPVSVQTSVPVVQEVAVKKNRRLLSCCRRSVDVIEPLVVREVAAAVAPAVAALVASANALVPSANVPSAEVLAAALVDAAVNAVADAVDASVDAAADVSAAVVVAPPQLEMAQVPSAELANEQSQTDSPVESVSSRVEESAQESANPVVPVESQ